MKRGLLSFVPRGILSLCLEKGYLLAMAIPSVSYRLTVAFHGFANPSAPVGAYSATSKTRCLVDCEEKQGEGGTIEMISGFTIVAVRLLPHPVCPSAALQACKLKVPAGSACTRSFECSLHAAEILWESPSNPRSSWLLLCQAPSEQADKSPVATSP